MFVKRAWLRCVIYACVFFQCHTPSFLQLPDCRVQEKATGQLISCMIEHKANISATNCLQFLLKMEQIIFNDYRLIYKFADACSTDIGELKCGRLTDDDVSLVNISVIPIISFLSVSQFTRLHNQLFVKEYKKVDRPVQA
jgi:hypothetical protein